VPKQSDLSRGQDFTQECVNDLQQGLKQRITLPELRETFCKRCKNPMCKHAGWADSLWAWRMRHQSEYLLENPNIVDPNSPEGRALRDQHKNDLIDNFAKEMRRIEQSSRGSWAPVNEEPPSADGRDEVNTDTAAHDEAMQKLAEARGKKLVRFGIRGGGLESPHDKQKTHTEQIQGINKAAEEAKEKESAAMRDRINALRERMGIQEEAPVPEQPVSQETKPETKSETKSETPAAEKAQPEQPQRPAAPFRNTDMPTEGIMVGGGTPPPPQRQQFPAQQSWAPRKKDTKGRVVKPGAKIKMGGGKKNDE